MICSNLNHGRSIVLAILGMAAGLEAVHAHADKPKPVRPIHSEAQARRLTIVRVGYGMAKPDAATIDVPFKVEGETSDAVTNKQNELLRSVGKALLPYDVTRDSVYITSGRSGQATSNGRLVSTYEGIYSVSVRDLSRLKAIVSEVGKSAGQPPNVKYHVTDVRVLEAARNRSQLTAIANARWGADMLAKAAGTHVIGIWELNEGEVKGLEPTAAAVKLNEDVAVPREIPVISAQITIVFEMAPSLTPAVSRPAIRGTTRTTFTSVRRGRCCG